MSLNLDQRLRLLDPSLIGEICIMKNQGIRIDNDEQYLTLNVPKSKIKALLKLQTDRNDVEFYKTIEALLVSLNGGVPDWLCKRN